MAFTVDEINTGNFELIDDVNGDGTVWECTYNVVNPSCDFVELLYEYTQDTSSNFTLKTSFTHLSLTDGDFYKETTIDLSASTINETTLTHSTEGNFRLIVPVTKVNDKVKFTFTPDVATGSDTLNIFCGEIVTLSRR